jgi:hypothetical protein
MFPFADKNNRFVEKDAGCRMLDPGYWILDAGYLLFQPVTND